VARIRDPNRDKAFEIYREYNGNIDLVEIARQLNVPDGTVRGWKAKDKWEQKLNGTFQKNNTERSDKKNAKKKVVDDGTKETLENEDLTPEQQLFCIYYSKSFNATQSYLKAYGCSYESAMANGPRLLGNDRVRKEIQRLKEIKRQQIVVSEEDMVEFHMRIAFADMGDYVTIEKGNCIKLTESSKVDTQLIKEIKEGRDGISIKLLDRCKSLEWLDRYFLMNPMDKHKIEYDKKKLELLEAQAKIPDSTGSVTIIDDIEGDNDGD